ncbi:NAD(+)--dinitrogen-reductase ADP-D-ribosyltransferase [Sulfurivermis fontis]|uniref:NAD(+)--dinitrogen-reductase ADP-D-ribosyltransferase n=1 Tax=Sulfurivermis fontis TaxID=1972068 RepID=UPI000FD8D3DB|nr:NAD(+)--dinitrogen-reductase ADP-D-ribosyltransferase [Sulfurivermis fontis]
MVSDKASATDQSTTLPACARLPINRCNLPAVILGSLTFQQHPTALHIDGVAELHRELFRLLAPLERAEHRAHLFMDYLAAHFLLDAPEEAGLDRKARVRRDKADYLRVLRGWSFDADGREAAVLKGWVESRFGLLPRYHGAPIRDAGDDAYHAYMEARAQGLYNTNALEAQLDLLYAYCQYELARQHPGHSHLRLYRGVNRLDQHDLLAAGERQSVVLLNNANSFTDQRERADEFGDRILEAEVPLPKILAYSRLLPGRLRGEDEYIVIGGVYQVRTST